MQEVLPLQNDIIYGPIRSRRLGRSLGINLLPVDSKPCTFNCVYCHYGNTGIHLKEEDIPSLAFPAVSDVIGAVERAIKEEKPFDYMTFSGNGEPTTHPRFEEIVHELKQLRDSRAPAARLALLSNSTMAHRGSVRRALEKIDQVMMKLDCGTAEVFRRYNRPVPGITLDKIVSSLKKLEGIIIQTIFTDGEKGNASPGEIRAWREKIREIHPLSVQIYTNDRPTADAALLPVSSEKLEEIASVTEKETGVAVSVH